MKKIILAASLCFVSSPALSQDTSDEAATQQATSKKDVQDMSDPLAVFTQIGLGTTNKGLYLKIGQAYDSGKAKTMAMNLLEVRGIWGESTGWDDEDVSENIDGFRIRNFQVDMTNGRGVQTDLNYNFKRTALAKSSGTFTYGAIQALPTFWIITLYPVVAVGTAFGLNATEDDGTIDSGYSTYGITGQIGMYSRFSFGKMFWLNYNPFYSAAWAGSDLYRENAYGPGRNDNVSHEFAASLQFTPRFNMRYFANWTNSIDFNDGDHRVEFNYQI